MTERRVAVVTGAGHGIGRGIADCLAAANYDVAIWEIRDDLGLQAAEEIRKTGVRAIAVACDVSDKQSVDRAVETVAEKLGRPHVLVNNAGINRIGRIEDVSLEDWDATLRINLTGIFLCTQAVGRLMLAARSGSIVNIASVSGTTPQVFRGAYSSAKAGVILLTKVVALEWASRGVRCNAVSPGPVRTWQSASVYTEPGLLEERRRSVPVRRIGLPTEIAAAVVFLASDAASFVTGANLPVDGGVSLTTTTYHYPTMGPDGKIIRPVEVDYD